MLSLELPPELWLQIFPHLHRNSLSSVSAVCHRFHAISSPLLFARFQYRPGVSLEGSMRGSILTRELERLAFWSSERIAPHVRTCFIGLYGRSITMDAVMPLVVALFEAVSRFTNLRVLSCNFALMTVELPALRLGKLAHLETLQIHGPRLSRPDEPQQASTVIQVRKFCYTDINMPVDARLSSLAMLDPCTLRCMELSAGRGRGLEHFLGDQAAMAACHNLRTLRITFKDTDFTRIHACVAPFPAIRELIVDLHSTCRVDAIPPAPLAPHLDYYKGPAELLPLLLSSAPQTVVISRGSAGAVLDMLRTATGRPDSITALSVPVMLYADVLDGAVLRHLLGLCPQLAHLALDVSADARAPVDNGPTNRNATGTLCEQLATVMRGANALRSLVLVWRLDGGRETVPDRADLEVTLRASVPSLRTVSLSTRWS
ncbi:hypothetical protein DFH07DRAFT_1066520 [Mycena maculata]|uniref:F-box domain-containing protein n=1 Tax=Mycena maculata TaxID=230809 RepID=A0AAD7MPV7_9AGAR|nr:hypothetical protein DFH07DRAFT_1066520 [Mycena maculata]